MEEKNNSFVNHQNLFNSFQDIKNRINLIREKIQKNRLHKQKDLIDIEKLNNLMEKNSKNYIRKKFLKQEENIKIYKPKYYIPKLRYIKSKKKNLDYYECVIDGTIISLDNNKLFSRSSSMLINNLQLKNKNKTLLFNKSQVNNNNKNYSVTPYTQKNLNLSSSYSNIKRKKSPYNKEFYRMKICQLHNKLFEDSQIECNKTPNIKNKNLLYK
jgi:hypothetical protein